MKGDNMKKPWEKPELVVLVKARPEESVLTPCKYQNFPDPKPGSGHGINCKYDDPPACPTCSKIGVT